MTTATPPSSILSTRTEKSWELRNRVYLLIISVANILIFAGIRYDLSPLKGVVFGTSDVRAGAIDAIKSALEAQRAATFLFILGLLCVGLFTDAIPTPVKEFFVFFRVKDRLPSFRAFSKFSLNHRVDGKRLRVKVKPWPSTRRQENTRWRDLYNACRADVVVANESKKYIRYRECTVTLTAITFVCVGAKCFGIAVPKLFIGVVAAEVFFANLAARQSGEKLVVSVLDIASRS